MEQLEAKLEDTNRRLSQLSQQIAETQGDLHAPARRRRGGTAPAVRPAPGASPGAARAAAAPAAPGARRPPSSTTPPTPTTPRAATPSPIQGFEDYLASYPSTDLSDNAQYWIGESHFAQKKYPEASPTSTSS